jgi:hypothetical protein
MTTSKLQRDILYTHMDEQSRVMDVLDSLTEISRAIVFLIDYLGKTIEKGRDVNRKIEGLSKSENASARSAKGKGAA